MKAVAAPTTMVLTTARMPIDARTATPTRRTVHFSPVENHENSRYLIDAYAGGGAGWRIC
ncbi:hypothetical protein CIW49_25505 [Mycolicibacterium sp. P1-18]|nr:hypothetical protein CIW49_25505 [Mycolicibacterium sp. P1-18]